MTDIHAEKIAQAEEKIRNEDYTNAISMLLEVIDEDSRVAAAYNDLGIIAWQQSRWEDAYGLFKEAVTLDNSKEDTVNNLLDAAFKLHKVEEIAALIETAAKDNPDNPETAMIYKAVSDKDNEIYKCLRALLIGYYNPLIEAGDNFIKNGEYLEALKKYIEAFDTAGPSAEVYNGLAIVQFCAKEYYEAFLLFFELLKLNPINRDTFLNLFDSARECGQEETALQIYEILSAEYPQLEQLREEAQSLSKK
jgi:tetratricopeptide (TPR) repeat protein